MAMPLAVPCRPCRIFAELIALERTPLPPVCLVASLLVAFSLGDAAKLASSIQVWPLPCRGLTFIAGTTKHKAKAAYVLKRTAKLPSPK